jgi:putative hydrolase of the HAD superfamily
VSTRPPPSSAAPGVTAPVRAVSFDAAGTLFHTARPVGELYATVDARHGVDVDAAALHTRFRAAFGAAPPLAFPGAPADELRAREQAWWRDVVARVFASARFADFDAFFADLFTFFASPAAWRVDSDAHALLATLRARALTILVVSNFDARVRGVLAALGLAPLVDHVTISSEAGAAKPDPAIFHRALGDLALEPGALVHVGDTVREDLRGARAAGVRVVLVGGAELAAEAPDALVVTRLGEVANRIADAR